MTVIATTTDFIVSHQKEEAEVKLIQWAQRKIHQSVHPARPADEKIPITQWIIRKIARRNGHNSHLWSVKDMSSQKI